MADNMDTFMYEYEGKEYAHDDLKAVLMAEIKDNVEVISSGD